MKNKFLKILAKLVILNCIFLVSSCTAQEEEELIPVLEEINVSDCDYIFISGTDIVRSKMKLLSSTQIFDTNEKQGVVSVFFEVEYDGHNYNLNFHTESNIFDNYLGFSNSDIKNHELPIDFYFEGFQKQIEVFASNIDLIESRDLIKPDSFIGYTFTIENVSPDLLDMLIDKKLIKFSIHEDMFGIYSSYRKNVSDGIKCVAFAKK